MKLAGSLILCVFFFQATAQTIATVSTPIHQLRIYEIYKDKKEPFHVRFRDHAKRIMEKYQFKIVSIWESEHDNKLEFVYLLEWKDENAMKEAWAQMRADEEWKEIKRVSTEKYGELVGEIEDRTLRIVDYSPAKSFSVKN